MGQSPQWSVPARSSYAPSGVTIIQLNSRPFFWLGRSYAARFSEFCRGHRWAKSLPPCRYELRPSQEARRSISIPALENDVPETASSSDRIGRVAVFGTRHSNASHPVVWGLLLKGWFYVAALLNGQWTARMKTTA